MCIWCCVKHFRSLTFLFLSFRISFFLHSIYFTLQLDHSFAHSILPFYIFLSVACRYTPAESAHIQFLYLFLLVLMRDRCDIKGMTRYFSRFDCHSLKENNPNHFFMIPPTFRAVHHINTIVIRSLIRSIRFFFFIQSRE